MSENYQERFLTEAIRVGALSFGEFTLKSGRVSPYFFNAGKFSSGQSTGIIADCYAGLIESQMPQSDLLFGPAYKGIPLVAATAVTLSQLTGREIPFCFNRKEAKDHGEGGKLVGAQPSGKVIIIDDVITAGTAIREAMALLSGIDGCEIVGCALALDRQEKGLGGLSAVQELEASHNIPVKSIIGLADLINYVGSHKQLEQYLPRIEAYRDKYGV